MFDQFGPNFVEALKNLAEVVALAVVGYLMLRLIVGFIIELLKNSSNEAQRNRQVSEDLRIAILTLTNYLQRTDTAQQLRSDRNMLMNQDRFDDLEFILLGILPETERDRILVVQERRKQREINYARFLTEQDEDAERHTIS